MSVLKANKLATNAGATYNSSLQIVQGVDTGYRTISGSGGLWVQATINRRSLTSAIKINFSGMISTDQGDPDIEVRLWSSLDQYIIGGNGSQNFSIQQNYSSTPGCIFSNGTDNQGYYDNWTMHPVSCSLIYQPSTSVANITIQVYVWSEGSTTFRLNRDAWGGGGTQSHNPPAVLILTELDQ
jgi:hypothetical protein